MDLYQILNFRTVRNVQKKGYLNEFYECEECGKCKKCNKQRRNYLNGFQICNTCYKQMKQITPNGFRPNIKFVNCKKCHQKKSYLSEFNECDLCILCISGNEVIDNFIKYTNRKIKFIPYCEFEDVEFIAEGGFSKIYKATWTSSTSQNMMIVVLKELNNSKNIDSSGLNEVKYFIP